MRMCGRLSPEIFSLKAPSRKVVKKVDQRNVSWRQYTLICWTKTIMPIFCRRLWSPQNKQNGCINRRRVTTTTRRYKGNLVKNALEYFYSDLQFKFNFLTSQLSVLDGRHHWYPWVAPSLLVVIGPLTAVDFLLVSSSTNNTYNPRYIDIRRRPKWINIFLKIQFQ